MDTLVSVVVNISLTSNFIYLMKQKKRLLLSRELWRKPLHKSDNKAPVFYDTEYPAAGEIAFSKSTNNNKTASAAIKSQKVKY